MVDWVCSINPNPRRSLPILYIVPSTLINQSSNSRAFSRFHSWPNFFGLESYYLGVLIFFAKMDCKSQEESNEPT